MKRIDLTRTISEDMPVYPGTEPPRMAPANSYEKDGFKETLLTMYSHTGTHMDPPAHLLEGGLTLDRLPVDHFVGSALVVDCRDAGPGQSIGLPRILAAGDRGKAADYLLFNTGWNKYWGHPQYFGDYPFLTEEAAEYIAATGKKGVGVDVIGVDPIADENLTIHRLLFANPRFVVIENLVNLELCGQELFTFVCLPLLWKEADGSPARAIAMLDGSFG